MKHTAFFGDGEKTFALTEPMILELERITGHGIGAIFTRIQVRQYTFREIVEVIRLGLVGGGTSPAEAAQLVAAYSLGRPLGESLALALGILATLFFGAEEPEADADAQDDLRQAAATGDASAILRARIAEAYADLPDEEAADDF